jgi:NADP-dependent 3-hydroxy acid dehydrogenase YdfG
MRITTPFTATSTAADVIQGIELGGKRAVVTGGASGIGVETATSRRRRRIRASTSQRSTSRCATPCKRS